MPKRFHLKHPNLAKAVTAALAQCQDVARQQRLQAIHLACGGLLTAAEIAGQVGISRRQLFNWVKDLKDGGIPRLLRRQHGGGARPQIKGRVKREFQAGLRTGRWASAREIQRWLAARHQLEMSLIGVYYWLGKLRAAPAVPRPANASKKAWHQQPAGREVAATGSRG